AHLAVRVGLQHARDDVLAEELPRARVAEEGGDVDQDRVEQQPELVVVRLEMAAVGEMALDLQLLHALRHAPPERRSLVAGEIEAAGGLEVLEQLLEPVVRHHGHRRPSPSAAESINAVASSSGTRLAVSWSTCRIADPRAS